MKQIANLRLKIANLLGYKCYADYVLERRMAENTPTVTAFLDELLGETKAYADKDYRMISDYAASLGFKGRLMPWDWGYYSEKYKDEKYALNDEVVKPYLKARKRQEGRIHARQQALRPEFHAQRQDRGLSSRRDGL